MKILALAAHPDDVEFMCAGTLTRLRQQGHEIALVTVNNGSCGSATLPPEEIVRIRAVEARQAAALLDARFECAGIPDLESVFDNPTRRKITELCRRIRPDIVFTHYPDDYMSDHEVASLLARDAAFTATLANYPTGAPDPAPKLDHIPHLYYFAPMEGKDCLGQPVAPDFVVDVTAVMDKKIEMLCCHASQREWLRSQHGIDEYIEFLKREAARVGAAKGYAYGEGFRQHLGHAYPQDNIVQRLLQPQTP